MNIEKSMEFPIECRGCGCESFMNNLTIRELKESSYLLKGNCIICRTKYYMKIADKFYRELKIQIILDSE